jgi:thiosulfate/3-mercaptopyruvate sulfurtransferase
VFLVGAILGGVFYNELFPLVKSWASLGESGVVFVYDSLGMPQAAFAFLFTLVAVGCFWGSEYIERKRLGAGLYWNSPFLKAFSLVLVVAAGSLSILPATAPPSTAADFAAMGIGTAGQGGAQSRERGLLAAVDQARDHIEPMELADRLLMGEPGLLLVDVRPEAEFRAFHIRGAVNIALPDLPQTLAPHRNQGLIVLYSNGMTHPAQARDALARMGFANVYILTDGLEGFIRTCLKPASLRAEPLTPDMTEKIGAWRSYFLAAAPSIPGGMAESAAFADLTLPGLVETEWLGTHLGDSRVKIIDLRTQPEYNSGHVPGSLYLSVESLRGVVHGVPSMLLPAEMLAQHFSLLGIEPTDLVVLVYGDRPMDATLVSMACERLEHQNYAILSGGFGKWTKEGRPTDTVLPPVATTRYPVKNQKDSFTVDYKTVLAALQDRGTVILDVRPADFHTGKKSDEARAGRIPGAKNRPFSEDITKQDEVVVFKPVNELAAAYGALIPSRDTRLIVHCRTGHQASQTFFVLKRLLGYSRVFYYDAGWTEWSARAELPIEKD